MSIRPPAVAGTFYPSDPRRLETMVAALLAAAAHDSSPAPIAPEALIVPHAGFVYSGPVAAVAYALLEPLRDRIERIVLLGPAHRVAVRGLAVPSVDAFHTPLGAVPIDREAIAALADSPAVGVSDRAHAAEHSLEVQLPFLQRVLGEFSLVPLVVGEASDEEVAEVIERLWGGSETLVVVSSDLSHDHDYETARRLDAATCAAIEHLDADALDWDSACGRIPVRGLLHVARRHGLAAHTLDLRSSGDTAGDRSHVVGYGAWSFSPARARASCDPGQECAAGEAVGEAAGEAAGGTETAVGADRDHDTLLLDLARRSIASGVETGRPMFVDPARYPEPLRAPGATFVTLSSPDGVLRGCIGSLEPRRALAEDVAHNAFAAAFRDPRMLPVAHAELAALHIEISVLGPHEPLRVRSIEELLGLLRPGLDGVVLEDFGRRATFLPQVWSQLPDPRAFVGAIWQKAGLPPDHWSATTRAWRYDVRAIAPPEAL